MRKTLREKVFDFCDKPARRVRVVFGFVRGAAAVLFRACIIVKQDKFLLALLIILAISMVAALPVPAWAGESSLSDTLYNLVTVDSVAAFIARFLFIIAYALGWMVAQVFTLVVMLASFNDFITMPAIERGWVIVRDVVNLFFVFILLFIAISEILHLGKYSAKQLVPKVLAAAVLINFSKMLCGLMIDLSQVVMMTFVNGFKETAGGNVVVGLGFDKMLDTNLAKNEATGETQGFDVLSGIVMTVFLACVLLLMVLIVVFFIAALLALRIAVLMFLVVLSPFAFVFAMVPISKKFSGKASQWWDRFVNYVTIGPMLAFFLWLSLLMMSMGDGMLNGQGLGDVEQKLATGGPTMGYIDNMMMFAISLAMLVASLMAAVETGGFAAQLGQMGMARMTKTVRGLAAPVTTRAAAVWGGFQAQRKAAQEMRLAKWGRAGKRAFALAEGVKELPRTAVSAGVGAATGGAAMTLRQLGAGGAEAYERVRAAGGTRLAGVRAALGGAAERVTSAEGLQRIAEASRRSAAGFRRFSGFDNAGQVAAQAATAEANKGARAEATQQLKALNIFDDKDKRRDVIDSISASSQEKQVALLEHAKKGMLEQADIKKAEKSFGNDKEGLKEFMDTVKKNQAHLAYDVKNADGQKKLKEDIQSGEFDLTKLSAENLKQISRDNPEFMNVVMESSGKDFVRDLDKLASKSSEHASQVAAVLDRAMEKMHVDANVTLPPAPAPTASQADRDAYQAAVTKKNEATNRLSSAQGLLAATSGNAGNAFAQRNNANGKIITGPNPTNPTGPAIPLLDQSAMRNFMQRANAKQINSIDFNSHPEVVSNIAPNIKVTQLSNLVRSGEAGAMQKVEQLIEHMADEIQREATAQGGNYAAPSVAALKSKFNLNALVSNNDIMNALAPSVMTKITSIP